MSIKDALLSKIPLPQMPQRKLSYKGCAACGCHMGKKRRNNEDNFYFDGQCLDSENTGLPGVLVKEGEDASLADRMWGVEEEGWAFYAVFDGMGGGDYGEVASNLAAVTAKSWMEEGTEICPCDITVSLEELCRKMNGKIFEAGVNLGAGQMGSTVTSLFFYDDLAWVCNVGDSRCFRLRDGELMQISVDHTDEEEMRRNGITGRKPYLTQYLGVDPGEMRIEPYIKRYALRRGDRFLLCSDGLTDMVPVQVIYQILSNIPEPEECVHRLIQAALDGGGKDNITVIVYQV